ncbi:ribosomal protein L21-like protein [Pavlovales sp. CCMP2436]|nr:ribosomal protein L21-like protein [Pavlovales sp. CCMP2436]
MLRLGLSGLARSFGRPLVQRAVPLPLAAARISTTHTPITMPHIFLGPADHFAIIALSGTQFKVTPDSMICTTRLVGSVGSVLTIEQVLLAGSRGKTVIGSPQIEGATVQLRIEEHTLQDKVIVFKKKRRKGYRRWQGHRQGLTIVRVLGISVPQLEMGGTSHLDMGASQHES